MTHPTPLIMDGYDDCILGLIELPGGQRVVCYDRAKVLEQLTVENNGDVHDAIDFHEFNQSGAYMGPATPVFLDRFTIEEINILVEKEDD